MTTFLSKEVHADLIRAQKDKKLKKSRLRVEFNGALVPVLKHWESGFSMDIEHAPNLRGLADELDAQTRLDVIKDFFGADKVGEVGSNVHE